MREAVPNAFDVQASLRHFDLKLTDGYARLSSKSMLEAMNNSIQFDKLSRKKWLRRAHPRSQVSL